MIRPALLLTTLTLAACAPEHLALERPFELLTPKDSAAETPMPLVILAHGYGVNGRIQDFVFPFSKQVDARAFRYALPQGTEDRNGRRFWNATDGCCNFGQLPIDDVAFFRALIDEVKSKYAVSKVFMLGHSNGGFMTLRMACDASDVIDGAVSVSGSTWNDFSRCGPGRAIPLLLVHGDQDSSVPYDGRPGRYPGARETAERFARRAGCQPSWSELGRSNFVGDAAEETRRESTGCSTPLELWTLEGVGHAPVFDAPWTGATLDWLVEHAP